MTARSTQSHTAYEGLAGKHRPLQSAMRYDRNWPTPAGISRFLNGGSSFRGCCNRPQLWLKENGDSARSQSPLMQINADTVCLVRTQFWQINSFISSQKASLN
jgi:hypothetical protein